MRLYGHRTGRTRPGRAGSNGRPQGFRRRGFFTADLILALGLVIATGLLVATSLADYRRNREEYYARQAAQWAAHAQLQRCMAAIQNPTAPPAGVLPEGLQLEQSVTPGRGQWEGFGRLTVTASLPLRPERRVHETAQGYIPLPASEEGGTP